MLLIVAWILCIIYVWPMFMLRWKGGVEQGVCAITMIGFLRKIGGVSDKFGELEIFCLTLVFVNRFGGVRFLGCVAGEGCFVLGV